MSALRTALVVPVPEAAGAVDEWRERTSGARPSAGVPPHITIAFPFVPAAKVDRVLVARLAELIAGERVFSFELKTFGRFPETLFLAPEPATPLVVLHKRIASGYPEYPLYGRRYAEFVPHLTVAEGDSRILDEAEAAVAQFLPLYAEISGIALLEETEPEGRGWRIRARLPLEVTGS